MRVFSFSREHAEPIELYDSVAASSVRLGDGAGAAHVYCIHFEAGGGIGAHHAGPAQLFLIVAGEGWAAGADGEHVPLQAGQGAFFAPGELHSKGSEGGMMAIMVQVAELELVGPEVS